MVDHRALVMLKVKIFFLGFTNTLQAAEQDTDCMIISIKKEKEDVNLNIDIQKSFVQGKYRCH